MINDILIVADEFQCCNVSHVKSTGNSVAHFLTKKSVFGSELQVWIESYLDDIIPLVTGGGPSQGLKGALAPPPKIVLKKINEYIFFELS